MNWNWAEEYALFTKKQLKDGNTSHRKVILAGYYNHNVVVEKDNQRYLLRIPIENAETMDYRLIPETEVLPFLEEQGFIAPRLLYRGKDDWFFIHSYFEGQVFNDLYPASTPFPDWVPKDIATQMRNLHSLDVSRFSKFTEHIARTPNSSHFYNSFIEFIQKIYNNLYPEYKEFYSQLGFPDEPLAIPRRIAENLTNRDFTFCHCDVHRKNLIITPDQNLVFLDWELVLITDPLYDIAVHFHKMRYNPHQEQMFLETYLDCNRETERFQNHWEQIQIYLKLERIKSAIIDFSRYYTDVKAGIIDEKRVKFYSEHFYVKLMKAWEVWGIIKENIGPILIENFLKTKIIQ
ncbi:MAG: aminoglycoside phosphotransferase family protein [Promethearchaeota archaeon]|nr:MAG: aminoglycoside phosphotransferase family protein [Candidatus Lokiarchaeota archaeon]